jgi:hypothetical protein
MASINERGQIGRLLTLLHSTNGRHRFINRNRRVRLNLTFDGYLSGEFDGTATDVD